MTRSYREISYTAPLTKPLEVDAYHAPDEGEWRVIVFPGTPCNKLLYTRFLRTAPRGSEVIVLSRPGFGKGHTEPVTDFREQIAAIKPFLEDGKKIIAMGVSYGGALALNAALEYSDTIKGVVTVAALIDEPHDYALKLEKLGGQPGLEEFVPNRWNKVRAEIAGRRAQIGPLLHRLSGLSVPVEILHGDFDALVPRANAEKLALAIGEQASLEVIPGGTHYLELQYPRRLHRAIARLRERAGQD